MKILIVEDDTQIATLYKKILDEHGFDCDIASTLDYAFKLLENNTYACHLVDLCLRGDRNTGWEIVTAGYKPIIVVSAIRFEDFEFKADVQWIRKPVDIKALVRNVIDTIKSHKNARADTR